MTMSPRLQVCTQSRRDVRRLEQAETRLAVELVVASQLDGLGPQRRVHTHHAGRVHPGRYFVFEICGPAAKSQRFQACVWSHRDVRKGVPHGVVLARERDAVSHHDHQTLHGHQRHRHVEEGRPLVRRQSLRVGHCQIGHGHIAGGGRGRTSAAAWSGHEASRRKVCVERT